LKQVDIYIQPSRGYDAVPFFSTFDRSGGGLTVVSFSFQAACASGMPGLRWKNNDGDMNREKNDGPLILLLMHASPLFVAGHV